MGRESQTVRRRQADRLDGREPDFCRWHMGVHVDQGQPRGRAGVSVQLFRDNRLDEIFAEVLHRQWFPLRTIPIGPIVSAVSDVRVDVELAHPADVVWRALTECSLMNEWFIPTDLAPVKGGVYRAFPPAGLAGFTGPFDVDILEVVECERMRMRWRGEQLHSEVVWELADSDPGVSLVVTQSGFLGLSGDQRRADLAETYESLFRQK